jgi:hypothetical protein
VISHREDKRVWLAGGAVAAVLIALVAWFAAISPQLSAASSARADTDAARTHNNALQSASAKLKAQNNDVVTLRARLRAALTALPFDSGLPQYTRQLSQQASGNRIRLTSVIVGAATGAAPAGTTAALPSAPAAVPVTPAPSATTAVPPAAPAATAVISIPVTVVSTGKGSDQLGFLQAIQAATSRRALVNSAQLSPITGLSNDGTTTLTLQLTIFTSPLNPAARTALEKLLSGK